MTKRLHQDPRPHFTTARFSLYADVGRKRDTYTIFRVFCYFIFFVCKAIGYVWVRFLWEKSEALFVLKNLVIFLERQYKIRVCILYTNFEELNSEAAANYFAETGIIWVPFVSHAQQQNRLVEKLMRTIIEKARAQIVDSGLLLKLWAKFISNIVFLKIQSPSFTISNSAITPFQA